MPKKLAGLSGSELCTEIELTSNRLRTFLTNAESNVSPQNLAKEVLAWARLWEEYEKRVQNGKMRGHRPPDVVLSDGGLMEYVEGTTTSFGRKTLNRHHLKRVLEILDRNGFLRNPGELKGSGTFSLYENLVAKKQHPRRRR